jgi:hypothetical protein
VPALLLERLAARLDLGTISFAGLAVAVASFAKLAAPASVAVPALYAALGWLGPDRIARVAATPADVVHLMLALKVYQDVRTVSECFLFALDRLTVACGRACCVAATHQQCIAELLRGKAVAGLRARVRSGHTAKCLSTAPSLTDAHAPMTLHSSARTGHTAAAVHAART